MVTYNKKIVIAVCIVIIIAAISIALYFGLRDKDDETSTKTVKAVALGLPIDSSDNNIAENNLLYSYNGKTWTKGSGSSFSYSNSLGEYNKGGVAYGNGRWVAVSSEQETNKNILYSDDGISWNPAFRNDGVSPFYNGEDNNHYKGCGVAYGDNMWVAVGKTETNSDENILYSSNGICWNVANILGGGVSTFIGPSHVRGGYNVKYNNNLWVAVGDSQDDTQNILYSTNGISWQIALMDTGVSPFVSGGGYDITFDTKSETWYAVGEADGDNSSLLSSTNGSCWYTVNANVTNGGSFFYNGAYSIDYSAEKDAFVATGISTGDEEENVLYSKNAMHWSPTTLSNGISYPFNGSIVNGNDIEYSSDLDLWLATGGRGVDQDGGTLLWSSNGISWNTTIMTDGVCYPFGESDYSTGFDIAVRN